MDEIGHVLESGNYPKVTWHNGRGLLLIHWMQLDARIGLTPPSMCLIWVKNKEEEKKIGTSDFYGALSTYIIIIEGRNVNEFY